MFFALGLLWFELWAMATPFETQFFSPTAREALLIYESQAEFHEADGAKPDETRALAVIDQQVKYDIGALRSISILPKQDQRIILLRLTKKDPKSNTWKAMYRYEGTVLVENAVSTSNVNFVLPLRPETVQIEGVVLVNKEPTHPCRSAHDPDGSFDWYYWNPYRPGCPLVSEVNFITVQGTLEFAPPPRTTSPEYGRLLRGRNLVVSLLVGMDSGSQSDDAFISKDANAWEYLAIRARLLELGFKPTVLSNSPTREEFTRDTAVGKFTIRAFFGQTSPYISSAAAFQSEFRTALEEASVVIYNGHSGLGANLDLMTLEWSLGSKISPPRDLYQIYFFYGCVTYAYYLDPFFAKKMTAQDPAGTRNLDIISSGRAVGSNTFDIATTRLIGHLLRWANTGSGANYDELLRSIDNNALLSVSGDEDNP